MNVLFRFAVLMVLITSCSKDLRNETLEVKPGDRSSGASSLTVYPIGSHLWTSLNVPDLTGSVGDNPDGRNQVIQVNDETLCSIGGHLENTYRYAGISEWQALEDDNFYSSFGVSLQFLFSHGSKIYYGMNIGPDSTERSFYCRDEVTKVITRLATFPGLRVGVPTTFVIGDKGYLLSGFNRESNSCVNRVWEYDIPANKWTDKGASPIGERLAATAMVVDSKVFIGMGYTLYNINGQQIRQDRNDWKVYYPASGLSGALPNFPGERRSHAKGFVLANNPYMGFGDNGTSFYKDFWKYDVSSAAWVRLTDWPGSPPTGVRNISTFSIGKTGYVVKGTLSEFWRFSIP